MPPSQKDFIQPKQPPYELEDLPPLIVGGAVFNSQYSDDPDKLPITEIFKKAFDAGVVALDTSPYYGPSEILIGKALKSIRDEWPREKYFICTKAGRVKLDEFDYSRQHVSKSVERSLERLNTSYLDLVYMHDVEFVDKSETLNALRELVELKKEGVVKNIGITGYPVEYVLELAIECNTKYRADIGPLDGILSYAHGCLQNTRLFDLSERFFKEAGIKKLMNGSILSMSLLRSGSTHEFHPAPEELKNACSDIAKKLLDEDQVELADLATRYAIEKTLFSSKTDEAGQLMWDKRFSVVLGVSSVKELMSAIDSYGIAKAKETGREQKLYKKVQDLLGTEHFNETWPSGKH